MPTLNPNSLKIGYVVLVSTRKFAIEKLQRKANYGDGSKWTHVAGSLGGYTAIEANIPRSRLINPVRNRLPKATVDVVNSKGLGLKKQGISNGVNLQKEYVDKGYEIKVMKRRNQEAGKRYKVALWWATMNNLPYDVL